MTTNAERLEEIKDAHSGGMEAEPKDHGWLIEWVEVLDAAIQRVLALHEWHLPDPELEPKFKACRECEEDGAQVAFPCATRRAIEGSEGT